MTQPGSGAGAAFSCLIEAFWHQVHSRGERAAVVAAAQHAGREIEPPVREISWCVLGAMVEAASQWLALQFERDHSLPRRVGHASDNSLSDLVIALASMSLGAIEFPLDHRLGEQEIERRWESIGGLWIDDATRRRLADPTAFADVGVWDPTQSPATQSVPSQPAASDRAAAIDPDAPSLVLWTSGTTGTPRGVTLSAGNLYGNAVAKLAAVPQTPQDVRLCILPLCHAYARTCDFGTWLLSGCVFAVSLGYDGLRRLAPLTRPTLINSVPSIAYRMLQDPELRGLDRLRLLGCGGAAISEAAFLRWQQRGVTVIQGYGLTETSPVICSATPEDAVPGMVGRFVDGWEWRIRDQQLLVRGPHVMLGYWNDPAATAERIDAEGWLATGDQVEIDPNSRQVRVLGRADDVIVLDNARKIHPETVERAVLQLAGVRHVMLILRQQLELWFDPEDHVDVNELGESIRGVLNGIEGLRGCSLHTFPTPLQHERGELTSKGTLRRRRIMATRFGDQAGS